jgi:gliding motility-associated-like protein
VTPSQTSNFAPIANFCSGTVAPSLGLSSPNGVTGTWSPATVSNTTNGSYVFTPNAGQCAVGQTLNVVVIPYLIPDFPATATLCSGGTPPTLAPSSPNGVPGTWFPAVVSNTADGVYTFTPTPSASQCSNPVTLIVTVNDLPAFDVNGGCVNGVYVLNLEPITLFNPAFTYSWSDSSHNPIGTNSPTVEVTTAGVYYLTVTNVELCSATEDFTADGVDCIIQKGISPNGDGKNDTFDLTGMGVKHLSIFNRYGTKVYSFAHYTNEWHGQSDSGQELPDATYYYVLQYDNAADRTGWIYINQQRQ